MKKVILGLLTVSAFGFLSVPAFAGDSAVIGDSEQINTQIGDGNSSRQDSYLSNDESNNRRRGNSGVVQTQRQDSFQKGDHNVSRQRTRQENRSSSRR